MEFLTAAGKPRIRDVRTTSGTASGPRRGLICAWAPALVLAVAVLAATTADRPAQLPPAARTRAPHQGLSALPSAAQSVVSATLGADNPVYSVGASSGGLQAKNPAQRLRIRFGTSGVQIGIGGTRVGVSLSAVGYGAALAPVAGVAPTAKANRATYARRGLTEWYRNGPLGLEQGFTIPHAPSAHPAGPLTLSMALSGNARASLAAGGQSLALRHQGEPSLRYTGLAASDARGRTLRGWLELDAGRVLLRVDARVARYPLKIDPLIQQGEKLTGAGESGMGEFGASVALSADGNTALIGGDFDNERVGAAWVFTRSGSAWTQQGAKLTGVGESGMGKFGESVALSSDGNTALIGGSIDNSEVGAAWVFTRSGSTWTQQGAKLTGGGESGKGQFGRSVALSADGGTALVGGDDDNGFAGAAWVFTRSGSTWTQQGAKLTGGKDSEFRDFGMSVALSADGNTALIGGIAYNEGVGAAWVFTRSGSVWTQQGAKLTGSAGTGFNDFGISVALSADGNTALIGSDFDNERVGAAWVFTRSGSVWTQQGAKLTGSGESGKGAFGSVALSADGNTALIGGPVDNGGLGTPWVFVNASHSTATSVICSPSIVPETGTTTCTTTVTDTAETGATIPTGTVSVDTSGMGSFSGEARCELKSPSGASSSCSVTYRPSDTPERPEWSDAITASYGGDETHESSKGTTAVTFISCPTNSPQVDARWHYSADGRPGKWSKTGEAKCGQTITLGPQAMGGDLKVSPGAKLKAGYDFTLPGNKSAFTVSFTEGKVAFAVRCVSGKTPSEPTVTVPLSGQTYVVTNANWYPSGEQKSPLTYQGEIAVPNLCEGGKLTLKQGGTFSSFMTLH